MISQFPQYLLDTRRPQAMVIHCGDARFQSALRRFVTEALGVQNYFPVVVGGGVHAFGAQLELPENFHFLRLHVEFGYHQFGLRDLFLFNHEDCLWYRQFSLVQSKVSLLEKGRADLGLAAEILTSDFEGIRVRKFWAAIDGDNVTFSEVT